MRKAALALLPLVILLPAGSEATIDYDRGVIAVSPSLGPSIGLNNASTLFKVGADLDRLFGQTVSFLGSLNFAFSGSVFNAEIAPGMRYRFLALYKNNVDLGIRAQAYFDFYRAGTNLFGFGVKFGPSFRYFVNPKLGVGMDFSVKLGAIDVPGTGFFMEEGGLSFGAILDLMFGVTFLF
jgi:hypothetical protein